MGALEDAADLASNLGKLVSPSSYEMPWSRFPKGIMSADYILSGIGPAFEQASRIYQTLDLVTPSPSEAASAWKVFADETTRIKKEQQSLGVTLLTSIPIVGPMVLAPAALAYRATSNVLGGLVAALYYTSVVGAFAHLALKDSSTQAFSIHKSVIDGDLTEQTAVAHAGWCYTGFKLIALLDSFKLLTPLKKPGMSGYGRTGLGVAPLVPILIAAVVGIAIIAGAIVISKNLSDVNALQAKVVQTKLEVMKETCAKATDPKIIADCAKGPTEADLRGGSLAAGISDALAKMGSDLAKYLAIGAVVLIGLELLPSLLPGLVHGVKAAKKEADAA